MLYNAVTYVEFTPVIQHGGCCPAARWDPPDETGPSQRAAEQAYRKHKRWKFYGLQ